MTMHSAYATQLSRYFLLPIGIWPQEKDTSFILRALKQLASMLCACQMGFLLIPCALHTFLEEKDPGSQLRLIGPMSFNIMAISKYYSLLRNTGKIGDCLQHVKQDWKFSNEKRTIDELEIMTRNAKLGRFLTILCATFMYGGGLFYHTIMPYSVNRMIASQYKGLSLAELQNDTSDMSSTAPRILVWPVYARLMHVDHSPIYEIVFVIQFISGYYLYTITIAACSLAAVFVTHICGQLEIVMRLLQNYANDVESEMAAKSNKMAEIVERHLRALNFAKQIEENLSMICFVEFIGCTMNICFLGYYFITEWDDQNLISSITYLTLLVSFTLNIFMFCYIGQILTDQCEKVGDVAYAIEWYNFRGKKAADLIMIIAIAYRAPAKLTANKITPLTLGTFCNVIKTSATYFNLLRTVML
ncbi:hypothetical protein QAD02_006229 [Eretmocerus hayati]|uniref:Uncharacterized protein n=1 Tax=Eretmocerus hayati TaxID=131215 RepID=A0ACC2N0N9_9HYME|nr:hypothetical protein QAD02_006229 [Eretmocerus hayati]